MTRSLPTAPAVLTLLGLAVTVVAAQDPLTVAQSAGVRSEGGAGDPLRFDLKTRPMESR